MAEDEKKKDGVPSVAPPNPDSDNPIKITDLGPRPK